MSGIDSESDLEQVAAYWEGMMFDPSEPRGKPAPAYRWRLEPNYRIDRIEDPCMDWSGWFQEEVQAFAEDGDPHRFDSMLDRPIQEEVILVEHEGRAWLWDGWHRTAASAHVGREHVPAIVGTLRTDRH